jgi:hypothetical protein
MVNKVLLGSFPTILALLLAIGLTPLEINSYYFVAGLIIAAIVTGIAYLGRSFLQWSTTTAALTSTVVAVCFGTIAFFQIWGSGWATQEIVYQHRHSANRTIEFQMLDVGALGYARRVVDQRQLLPGVRWILKDFGRGTNDVVKSELDSVEWKEVNIDTNELGLKFP